MDEKISNFGCLDEGYSKTQARISPSSIYLDSNLTFVHAFMPLHFLTVSNQGSTNLQEALVSYTSVLFSIFSAHYLEVSALHW